MHCAHLNDTAAAVYVGSTYKLAAHACEHAYVRGVLISMLREDMLQMPKEHFEILQNVAKAYDAVQTASAPLGDSNLTQ